MNEKSKNDTSDNAVAMCLEPAISQDVEEAEIELFLSENDTPPIEIHAKTYALQ